MPAYPSGPTVRGPNVGVRLCISLRLKNKSRYYTIVRSGCYRAKKGLGVGSMTRFESCLAVTFNSQLA
jgi:hypothetical protein